VPIEPSILQRLRDNDPTLTSLDLSSENLTAYDVQVLRDALIGNTMLTSLNLGFNQIGDEAARAFALPTLTTLDLSSNRIGDEGAKALAQNSTLTTLDLSSNRQMINPFEEIILLRNQLLRVIILLAKDRINPDSQSTLKILPRGIISHILSFMSFTSVGSIGKNPAQVFACAEFIFEHIRELPEQLKQGKQFELVEKNNSNTPLSSDKFQFKFFDTPKNKNTIPVGASNPFKNNEDQTTSVTPFIM
jgi:Leucine-rich repeat (LRR) protein